MSKTGPASVEFRAVTKRYGAVPAVSDVSFTIAPATLVTLLGPSGCGKTTTLRLIAGLEIASEGRVFIDGEDVTHLSAADRDVSMVFQSYALFPHMSVLDNVAYGPLVQGLKKSEARDVAMTKIELVGLKGLEQRAPSELSGGQQQRVAVARALVLEPRVLLFDEPLSNLDAKLRRRVRDEIRDLQRKLKLTVAYVTHDQEEALAVSDRIIVMANGRIAQDGAPRELYEEPANLFVADFIGDANLIDAELIEERGERALLRIGTLEIEAPRRNGRKGPVKIAIRPEAIVLSDPASSGPAIPSRILKAAYLGKHIEYSVETPVGTLFAVDHSKRAPLAAGADARVSFAPGGIVIVPA